MSIDPRILEGLRNNTLTELVLEGTHPLLESFKGADGKVDHVGLLAHDMVVKGDTLTFKARLFGDTIPRFLLALEQSLESTPSPIKKLVLESVGCRVSEYDTMVRALHKEYPGLEVVPRKLADLKPVDPNAEHGDLSEPDEKVTEIVPTLKDEDALVLAEAIKSNRSLRVLNLSGAKCGYSIFGELAEAMCGHPSLAVISLDDHVDVDGRFYTPKYITDLLRERLAGSKNILICEPGNIYDPWNKKKYPNQLDQPQTDPFTQHCVDNARMAERLFDTIRSGGVLSAEQCRDIRDRLPSIVAYYLMGEEAKDQNAAKKMLAEILEPVIRQAQENHGINIEWPPDIEVYVKSSEPAAGREMKKPGNPGHVNRLLQSNGEKPSDGKPDVHRNGHARTGDNGRTRGG